MTEYKRTLKELDDIVEQLGALGDGGAMGAEEKMEVLENIKGRLEGAIATSVGRFDKRLGETDPVSGQPRYGDAMRKKVMDLKAKYQGLGEQVVPLEEKIREELAGHRGQQAKDAEAASQAQRAERDARETRLRVQAELEEQGRQEAAAREKALEEERARVAEEANRSRLARQRLREEEEALRQEQRARHQREAEELRQSVVVGAAGAEAGLRSVGEACGADVKRRKATVLALQQMVNNVAASPEDPRFRRIRLDNENFQRAVGHLEGAVQVLLAAGFRMQADEGEKVLLMQEPDIREDADAWSQWYDNLKLVGRRLDQELGEL